MSEKHSLTFLVNPGPPPYVNVEPELSELASLATGNKVLVPPDIQEHLLTTLGYLRNREPLPPSVPSEPSSVPAEPSRPTTRYNLKITERTKLSILYEYPLGPVIEYPETSEEGDPVGHLFQMDPQNWFCPSQNMVYSKGEPKGCSKAGHYAECEVLLDSQGRYARCVEKHWTCQGCKVCPNNDMESLAQPHHKATAHDVQERLQNDRDERLQYASPTRDIFQKTAAYLAVIRKMGCWRPKIEETLRLATEQGLQDERDLYLFQTQRGYVPPEELCEGRVLFDHLYDTTINNGTYDLEYIEAVLCEDDEEVERIEEAAFGLGYGPRIATCNTVTNFSSQKTFCPFDHWDSEGGVVQPLMTHLTCTSRFRVFEPIPEDRLACPYILLVARGPHTHPIPLPTKTPPKVRSEILALLTDLGEDLPDITPRRLIRHPLVKAFLWNKFPNHSTTPTLSDWHLSLANRSHIGSYIKLSKELHYPFGTGWAGVVHLKAQQDALPTGSKYICRMIVVDAPPQDHEDEDTTASTQLGQEQKLRIIVCMSPEASQRLAQLGQYLQSDIGFKHVVGFLEFELACMDRDANTSSLFSRVYSNRQTTHAHFLIFQALHDIVKEDTGCGLQWRHLHGSDNEDDNGWEGLILSFMADQHRGQALGLGMYLQALAATLPEKFDLHEPWRTIQSLTPYEHLRRCFRNCTLHIYRNIKTSKVSNEVRWLMRSLVCIEHDDWDGNMRAICEKGGKVGSGKLSFRRERLIVHMISDWVRFYINTCHQGRERRTRMDGTRGWRRRDDTLIHQAFTVTTMT
ncbi:hypothetical protein C8R44DRAFT_626720 [Mycena epipterygia]|nr:hypothetical protein C8R44DRAFT_626720 [Mycena epipterygia]